MEDKPLTDETTPARTRLAYGSSGLKGQTVTAPVRTRRAHCCCGALRAETTDEPIFVAACSCQQCQRRTGSAFGMNTFWLPDQVKIHGESHSFSRISDRGGRVIYHFCPHCGSTVHWEIPDLRPGWVAIAGGAFADPQLAPPMISVWEQFKHGWVSPPATDHFLEQPE
jgi:hypothetical protein